MAYKICLKCSHRYKTYTLKRKYCGRECYVKSQFGRSNPNAVLAMKKASIGRKAIWNRNPEKIERQRLKLLGRPRPIHSKSMEGENNPNWRGKTIPKPCKFCKSLFKPNVSTRKICSSCYGTRTTENQKARSTQEYKEWRRAIFIRDNFTCKNCQKRGGDIQADHIKPFILYPELRLDTSNGRTLCIPCHREIGWSNKGGQQIQYEAI